MNLRRIASAAVCAFVAASAGAESLDGHIVYHNDVIYHSFILEQRSDLVAWTDSFMGGRNFDPIVAVWHDGMLLGQNDDNPTIAPDQTWYDSGLRLFNLMPGSYVFTIGAYSNFANSNTIGAGFRYDHDTPIPLTEWCEPASTCNMGPFVKLNWNLTPLPGVPEPSSWAMLAAGLAVAGATLRRRRHGTPISRPDSRRSTS